MQKDPFLNLSPEERTFFFVKAAEGTTLPPQAIEKDWWVTKVLSAIHSLDYRDAIQFKGGTSLSKGWELIERFSEDVDLCVDRAFLGFPGTLSKSQVSDKLRRKAKAFIIGQFYEDLQGALDSIGIPRDVYHLSNNDNGIPTQDPVQIYIDYDSVFPHEGYILPRVMLEVSGRSYEEAVSETAILTLLDTRLPKNAFSSSSFMVVTVEPERTFIEKVCLLHEEFNKSDGVIRCHRMSRHLYDLFMMCINHIDEIALNNEDLFRRIVMHRFTYNRIDGVDYNTETPGHFNIIPPEGIVNEWRKDYDEMKREMIYSKEKPSFDDIMARIHTLNTQLNEMKWKLVPVFSPGTKPYLRDAKDDSMAS